MGEASAVFREVKVSAGGKEYGLVRPSLDTEAIYETYLEDRAWEKFNRRRIKSGEEAYRIGMSVWQKDAAAGEYSWRSTTVDKAWRNREPFIELMFLLATQPDDAGKPRGQGTERGSFAKLLNDDAAFNAFWEGWVELLSPTPTMPPPDSGATT